MIEKMKEKTQKSEYVSPDMKVFFVEMEQGIAAGSARVVPPNNGGVVRMNGSRVMMTIEPLNGNILITAKKKMIGK
jgi:hypothetical protein